MEKRVFRSRFSVLIMLLCVGMFLLIGRTTGEFMSITILGVICMVCVFFQFRSLYYEITDSEIHTYYMWGFYGKPFGRMLISAITSVERSYYPFAVSGSIKRLRFRFKKGYKWYRFGFTPIISPVREKEFIEMLTAINPNIQINVNDKKSWWRIWDWDI